MLPSTHVDTSTLQSRKLINKLFVRERDTQIKIEVTPVLRGCVYEPEEKSVSDLVEEQFGFAVIQVVSLLDVLHAKTLPAVRWKLENLSHMDAQERAKAIVRLEEVLTQKS